MSDAMSAETKEILFAGNFLAKMMGTLILTCFFGLSACATTVPLPQKYIDWTGKTKLTQRIYQHPNNNIGTRVVLGGVIRSVSPTRILLLAWPLDKYFRPQFFKASFWCTECIPVPPLGLVEMEMRKNSNFSDSILADRAFVAGNGVYAVGTILPPGPNGLVRINPRDTRAMDCYQTEASTTQCAAP